MLEKFKELSKEDRKEWVILQLFIWCSWGIIVLMQAFFAQTRVECVLYGFLGVLPWMVGVWQFGKIDGFVFVGLTFCSGILLSIRLPGSWPIAGLAAIYYLFTSVYITLKVDIIKENIYFDHNVQKQNEDLTKENLMEKSELLHTLLRAIDAKDSYTYLHSTRVSHYAASIAKYMKLGTKEVEDISISGMLHDIGKIGVKESILNKTTKLDEPEMKEILKHPAIGAHIAGNLEYLSCVLPGIHYHHERYDGTGYPEGLKGDDIPLQARILAVADAFDAMTSKRTYRTGMTFNVAIKELVRNIGIQFDPKAVLALVELVKNKSV